MELPVALRQFSQAHQAALDLAQQISRARDAASISRLMASVPTTFQRELEPHFAAEEAVLLPQLEAAGEEELVRRTLDEHHNLRSLAAQIASGDGASLQLFWIALHALIRFEERQLFQVAGAVLPAALLDDDEQARTRDGSPSPGAH